MSLALKQILRRFGRDERGIASAWVGMMLTGLVAVIGLSVDGGLVFTERRDLQGLADAAALAGAMQLDEAAYRASGTVRLDPYAAQAVAASYLAGHDVEYEVGADTQRVAVTVRRRAETAFVRILGIDTVAISAVGIAEPRYGIATAGGG